MPGVSAAVAVVAGVVLLLAYAAIIRANLVSRRELVWTLVPALLLLGLIVLSALAVGAPAPGTGGR